MPVCFPARHPHKRSIRRSCVICRRNNMASDNLQTKNDRSVHKIQTNPHYKFYRIRLRDRKQTPQHVCKLHRQTALLRCYARFTQLSLTMVGHKYPSRTHAAIRDVYRLFGHTFARSARPASERVRSRGAVERVIITRPCNAYVFMVAARTQL